MEDEYVQEPVTGEELSGYEDFSRERPKKKKRKKKRYFLRFLIFCAVLVAAYFVLTSDLFTVTQLNVEGNEFYTAAQITEMAQLNTGYNIFKTKTSDAKELLLADPYIQVVSFKKTLPDTITIIVEERKEYAAVPYGGQYVLIDKEGMVLRISDTEPVLPLLEGMIINDMTPGTPLNVEQSYLVNDTLNLLAEMEENDLYFKKIYFSTVIVRAYIYDNLYCEGTPENITENMADIKLAVEDLYNKNMARGVIKVGTESHLTYSPVIE